MRVIKFILLWLFALVLCGTIYDNGTTGYYRYEDLSGWGWDRVGHVGEDLSDVVPNGEKYKYVGYRTRFDRNPEIRVAAIIAILSVPTFLGSRIVGRRHERDSDAKRT